jgi:hypothetical protein
VDGWRDEAKKKEITDKEARGRRPRIEWSRKNETMGMDAKWKKAKEKEATEKKATEKEATEKKATEKEATEKEAKEKVRRRGQRNAG